MRVGLGLGGVATTGSMVDLAREGERAGLDSVWTSDVPRRDAITSLALLSSCTSAIGLGTAVAQMFSRSPAQLAAAAATLAEASGGRFRLGVGVSTRRVLKSLHDVEVERPLEAGHDYLDRLSKTLASAHDQATLGSIPLIWAGLGPRSLALAADRCAGLIGLFVTPRQARENVEAVRVRTDPSFVHAVMVPVILGEDVTDCRDLVRPWVARYLRETEHNPYAASLTRQGFAHVVEQVQAGYASGGLPEACRTVPDSLIDEIALVGSRSRVLGRLELWADSGVDLLIAGTVQPEAIEVLAGSQVVELR